MGRLSPLPAHDTRDLFELIPHAANDRLPPRPTAVDLFAGAGGFTEGAMMAGFNVLWAANHWKDAVHTHAANHPEVAHACQDLQQADWREVPAHDALLASPACQGHAWARGKERAHHDATRSTAWAVIAALEFHRPQVAIVENVPEFLLWRNFPAWAMALECMGYAWHAHVIDAADCGVPQHRERVIIVITQSKAPLRLKLEKKPHRPVSDVLEFDAGNWSPIEKEGRAPATLARVQRGRAEFGDRFIMPYYGKGSGLTGRSLDRPIGTLTTLARWALVDGDRMRMLSIPEAKGCQGFRPDYQLPDNIRLAMHMLGNSVPPPMVADVLTAIQEQF